LIGSPEQVAIDAPEVAIDALVPRDGLDPIDGRGVALGGQATAVLAVDLLDLGEAVVDCVGQVG
jgi:hypothetical protein